MARKAIYASVGASTMRGKVDYGRGANDGRRDAAVGLALAPILRASMPCVGRVGRIRSSLPVLV